MVVMMVVMVMMVMMLCWNEAQWMLNDTDVDVDLALF